MALTLVACSSVAVNYTPLNAPPSPASPTSSDKVEVFTTQPPSRKYVEIGTLKGMHDSIGSDEDMFAQMKAEAAKHGCNALVVTQRGSSGAVASCIVYTEK